MATDRLLSVLQQPTSVPAKREYLAVPQPSAMPESLAQLWMNQMTTSPFERGIDIALVAADYANSQFEGALLRRTPTYRGEAAPTGDGSLIIIVPGLGTGKSHYKDPSQYLTNDGHKVKSLPMPNIINDAPVEDSSAAMQMGFILQEAYKSGRKVHLVGHSKGWRDIEELAHRFPREFEANVDTVFQIASPTFPYWVNGVVTGALLLNPLYKNEHFKAGRRPATALRNLRVKTISIQNPHDPVIRGASDAQERLTYEGSHLGAVSIEEILKIISQRSGSRRSITLQAA